jgi:hypothetical protein
LAHDDYTLSLLPNAITKQMEYFFSQESRDVGIAPVQGVIINGLFMANRVDD